MSDTLAKLVWSDSQSGQLAEYYLSEGATATIGRASNNDICIPNKHVSRQHAVITYRDGVFVISDLSSANGTFVNDLQLTEPFPLASGDVIRLYVPILKFTAVVDDDEALEATQRGRLITETFSTGKGQLMITSGPQEGHVIPLLLQKVTIGRATSKATWEIGLQDPSVSRPHARMELEDTIWRLFDLGSANGTFVNDAPVGEGGCVLQDGDVLLLGATKILYRAG